MPWAAVLASLERHIHAFKRGQDYDSESGLLHMAHVLANAAFLAEYYRIFAQGDDRPRRYLFRPMIGLDMDSVCADARGQHGIWPNCSTRATEPAAAAAAAAAKNQHETGAHGGADDDETDDGDTDVDQDATTEELEDADYASMVGQG